jgi:NitT/TauT family transport system permease protein
MRARLILPGLLPILGVILLWEVAARFGLFPSSLRFPGFSDVLVEAWRLTVDGTLAAHFLSSLRRVLIGLVAGSLAGILVGVWMGWHRLAERTFSPLVSLLLPIPALGWLPLLMLVIGIDELLPISIIFLCSFFPILYNTTTGIKTIDPRYLQAARTLGASEGRILLTVALPLAIPNIVTGLRLEAGMAWRVVIAAEMVAIPTGIGALMMQAESLVRIDVIIVALLVLSLMCFLFERFFLMLERRLTGTWR